MEIGEDIQIQLLQGKRQEIELKKQDMDILLWIMEIIFMLLIQKEEKCVEVIINGVVDND